MHPSPNPDSPAPPSRPPASRAPGLALASGIGALALALGHWMPLVGGAVFGILLGIVVRQFVPLGARTVPGIAFGSSQLLRGSIILLGFGLSLDQVAKVGMESLAVTLVTMATAFIAAWLLGRWLRVRGHLTLLIGVGTAICGGSAIAAVSPILRAQQHDVAFAISTVFLFNVAAVLVFPALGHAMGLSDPGFGLWAGTAINDTSSVVAAGYAYSPAAGDYATIVKLTRATFIIPICLVLAAVVAWRGKHEATTQGRVRLGRIFPWFILWFLLASGLRSAGIIPSAALPWLQTLAHLLIVVALTAVGLGADLRRMLATGPRPILLGLGAWIAVAASSLIVQQAIGRL
ncbi:MAG: YeiH family protein [Lysobacteraceae bacterium]